MMEVDEEEVVRVLACVSLYSNNFFRASLDQFRTPAPA